MESSSCTTMLQSKYGITILSYYNITTKSITLHEITREVKEIVRIRLCERRQLDWWWSTDASAAPRPDSSGFRRQFKLGDGHRMQ